MPKLLLTSEIVNIIVIYKKAARSRKEVQGTEGLSRCRPPLPLSVCCPDDPQILSPFDLPSKTLILFPINDNSDRAVAEGGTNWGRLVYDRASNEFVHRDSANGSNRWCPRRLYEAVTGFVGGDGDSRIVEGRTLQQRNVYDCGLFVIAIARVVCEWKQRRDEEERWFGALEEEVDAEKVERVRGEVLMLITSLMERK